MRRSDERGAAVVEFALVLPILLIIVFGIIDFGWTFYQQLSLSNAARESARFMAIHHAESDALAEAIEEGLKTAPAGAEITVESMCGPTNPEDAPLSVTATATVAATSLSGWYTSLFNGTDKLSAESKMICGG